IPKAARLIEPFRHVLHGRLVFGCERLPGASVFSATLKSYATDWAQMQKDYQQEQKDYQLGCGSDGYNASVVSYDASLVSYDLSSIQYDDSSLRFDETSFRAPLKQVQDDLLMTQTDWHTLQAALAADPTGTRLTQFSDSAVNAKLTYAQQQVDASNKALTSAQ